MHWNAGWISVVGPLFIAALLASSPLGAQQPEVAQADPPQSAPLQPGEAVITRFSGVARAAGQPITIDTSGPVGVIVDVRAPGQAAAGSHWINEPQRNLVSAADVGQVFGVALDDASPPNIYVSATSAFGLHLAPGGQQWMAGMWGPGGGPGTIYRLDAAGGYRPRLFAQIALGQRQNTGPALGNLAFDNLNKQLFVSDLETGMIHRVRASDGADLGVFDHGAQGRSRFVDAPSGQTRSLPPIPFNPSSGARYYDCPSRTFERSPECWNFAPPGRRVWGLGTRVEPARRQTRLFYAVWSGPAFGFASWAQGSEEEKRNAIWSVGIGGDGAFDTNDVRREFILPDFFVRPEDVARAGYSHPVSDISFAVCGDRRLMLLAERGGIRNLGLEADNAFAEPSAARALRYVLAPDGRWQPAGRYDVGFYDRADEGQPFLRANCAGGIAFGYGYGANAFTADLAQPDQTAWITGNALCSPFGPCINAQTGAPGDGSHVHGLQGAPVAAVDEVTPRAALQANPAGGPAYPPHGPMQSYLIDADPNIGPNGQVDMNSLVRNDATRIGDVAVYELCEPPRPAQAGVTGQPQTVGQPEPPLELPPAMPPEITVAKAQIEPACERGEPCSFVITLTNSGSVPWTGIPNVTDTLPPGTTPLSASPPWTCTPNGDQLACEQPVLTLAPGRSLSLTITIRLPPDLSPGVDNCVDGICIHINIYPPPPPPPPMPPEPPPSPPQAQPQPPPQPQPPQPPAPPKAAQCDERVQQGGDTPETVDISIANRPGTAVLKANTFTKKDRMLVFVDGRQVVDTGCVGTETDKDFSFQIPPGAQSVRVQVQPNCEAGTGTGTRWTLQLICPKPQPSPSRSIVRRAPPPPGIFAPPAFVPPVALVPLCPHGICPPFCPFGRCTPPPLSTPPTTQRTPMPPHPPQFQPVIPRITPAQPAGLSPPMPPHPPQFQPAIPRITPAQPAGLSPPMPPHSGPATTRTRQPAFQPAPPLAPPPIYTPPVYTPPIVHRRVNRPPTVIVHRGVRRPPLVVHRQTFRRPPVIRHQRIHRPAFHPQFRRAQTFRFPQARRRH